MCQVHGSRSLGEAAGSAGPGALGGATSGPDMEEGDDLGKTLAVSRFGDLISKPPAWDPEAQPQLQRRDFECG